MRIAQLAPLSETVPPPGYGGSELVVSLLTEELVRRGHEVTLFATADSLTEARLVSSCKFGLRRSSEPVNRWVAYELQSILALQKCASDFDLIHSHMGYLALPFLERFQNVVLSTNHNPIKPYCAPIYMEYKDLPYVAISQAYRKLNFPSELNYASVIHNGIDLDQFHHDPMLKRDYLLFLGRICSDKGTVEAIHIARAVGMPIILAGKIDKNDEDYFDVQVRPLLGSSVEYVGEVSFKEKQVLYRGALATLCPIKFEEPFGLVMAESLASGTPVVALRRGAVPELVEDGVTGIVEDSIDNLVSRFHDLSAISNVSCRESAELLFGKERMAERYEALYKELLHGRLAGRSYLRSEVLLTEH